MISKIKKSTCFLLNCTPAMKNHIAKEVTCLLKKNC